MNREELLAKIKEDNEYDYDPYEVEVDKLGWKIGSIGVIVVAMMVFFIEAVLYEKYNFGILFAIALMVTLKCIVSAIKLKDTFDIVMAIICGVLSLALLVLYIMSICYGWV